MGGSAREHVVSCLGPWGTPLHHGAAPHHEAHSLSFFGFYSRSPEASVPEFHLGIFRVNWNWLGQDRNTKALEQFAATLRVCHRFPRRAVPSGAVWGRWAVRAVFSPGQLPLPLLEPVLPAPLRPTSATQWLMRLRPPWPPALSRAGSQGALC